MIGHNKKRAASRPPAFVPASKVNSGRNACRLFLDGSFPTIGVEPARALIAGVGDDADLVDDEQADRRGDVFPFHIVIDAVDEHGIFEIERDLARIADLGALVVSGRRVVDDLFVEVLRRLPAVGGVRFANIDQKELDVVLVGLKDVIQSHGLHAEGRSCIGAEGKRHGPPP